MDAVSPPRVLVVEDDKGVATLSARVLEREGFEVDIRSTAEAAIEFLRHSAVDLAVLDFVLPDLDAQQLTERLGELGCLPPFIIASGNVDAGLAAKMMQQGAHDCLVKDGTLLDLLPEAVRRALQTVEREQRLKRAETERERYFDELQRANRLARMQAEELVKKNRELEQFAYIASHDLRAPLCTIKSNLENIEEFYSAQLEPLAVEFLKASSRAVHRMNQLIESLLEFSQAGRRVRALEPVDLNVAMSAALENLGAAINSANAEIAVSELPASVMGDEQALEQLLQNLLSNAIKFGSPAGPKAKVFATRDRELWRVSVADNGIGIKPQHREAIFTPFTRLHSRREFDGSGIGLATCQKIVEQHGGSIWVESEPGAGSTFSFTLRPAAAAG